MHSFNDYRVLIVDDEETVANTLALVLKGQGYETRVAYSAEQAVETMAEWIPDLALLDVILPGLHGIELATLIKARIPECRILLFSGQADTADLLQQAEANGHTLQLLAKPAHPTEVLQAVARLLSSKIAGNLPEVQP
jgi:CheY-like chemotaxis protein